jgi:hypothetical protein
VSTSRGFSRLRDKQQYSLGLGRAASVAIPLAGNLNGADGPIQDASFAIGLLLAGENPTS